jgi:hypothetical protein
MYKNRNFGNKWFYAFITKLEYENVNCTRVYIETDVYQTWLTETTLKKSFVVREHVSNDSIGANIIEEELETGEYVLKNYNKSNLITDLSFVVVTSRKKADTENIGQMYGNVYSALKYNVFTAETVGAMTEFINTFVTAGEPDVVQMIFTIPSAMLPSDLTQAPNQLTWTYSNTFDNLDGYIPKNNKLFTYPYNVLYLSNNQGGSATFRFEDFLIKNSISFSIIGNIAPNPTLICCPKDYKNHVGRVQEYGLSMSGFPLCSWISDAYLAWMSQNSASIGATLTGSAMAIVGGLATKNPTMIGGGITGVVAELTQIRQHTFQPEQARGNLNGGSLNVANYSQDFYLAHMTIKSEYAKIIDEFFSMYGYKVNTVKVPEITSRKYWNYVKTIDVNIDGKIPTEDMQRLKKMYNDGVTFWHSASNFCNFSLDNVIV